jgi:hypothetical protein
MSCHADSNMAAGEQDAPIFAFAGTAYPTAHEPTDCIGEGAQIVITDANGKEWFEIINAAGNFSQDGLGFAYPYRANIRFQGREREMDDAQSIGDCMPHRERRRGRAGSHSAAPSGRLPRTQPDEQRDRRVTRPARSRKSTVRTVVALQRCRAGRHTHQVGVDVGDILLGGAAGAGRRDGRHKHAQITAVFVLRRAHRVVELLEGPGADASAECRAHREGDVRTVLALTGATVAGVTSSTGRAQRGAYGGRVVCRLAASGVAG